MSPAPPPSGKTPQKPPTWASRLTWVIFAGLLLWNLFTLIPRPRPEAEIPYTTLLAQVKAGNVSHVRIRGAQITGKFVKPVTWPPKATTAKGPAAPSVPSPATSTPATQTKPPASPTPSPEVPTAQSYERFSTLFPVEVGDRGLVRLLERHDVTVDVAAPSNPWFVTMIIDWTPMLLLVGYFVWIARRASQQQGGILGFGRTRARRYEAESPAVTFADVAGVDEAKTDLTAFVDFLRHPEKYHEIGARIPRGILLVGPPGTGKTLLARAVAGEAHSPFYSISGSEFVEMFVGIGASRVRDLFQQAKAASPAIVFIDELDAVGRRRGAGLGAVNDEREQTLNQLLVEMDGFDERNEVVVLAATNRPDVLDPALRRPGRFDSLVTVGLPDLTGREGILRIHAAKVRVAPDVDLGVLARSTTGMSGADLANLCNAAALLAAGKDRPTASMADFEEALDRVRLGGARPALLDARERKVVAYHEGGHALVAWLTPEADPVHKVTIVPRGQALGVTEQLPGENQYNHSRSSLLARLDVMLAGRTSEEVNFGDVTTGAESDLVRATSLARRMVTRWGMGTLGPLAFSAEEEQPFLGYSLSQGRDYSEATAARIDQDVREMLSARHEVVEKLLTANRETLDRLAGALIQDETVGHEQLERILGPSRNQAR